MSPEEATKRAIWDEWNALPDDCPAPVKIIARKLGLPNATVAAVVYPDPALFGEWADDQEPDLDEALRLALQWDRRHLN